MFAAYYLSENSSKKILLIEKGKTSQKRNCPIKTYHECIKCKPCNILSGIGGARLFYVFEYEDRYIWGATAGMLMNLFRRLCLIIHFELY